MIKEVCKSMYLSWILLQLYFLQLVYILCNFAYLFFSLVILDILIVLTIYIVKSVRIYHYLDLNPDHHFFPDVFQEVVLAVSGVGQMGKNCCFSACSFFLSLSGEGLHLFASTVQYTCSKSPVLATELTFKRHQLFMCMQDRLNGGDRGEAVAHGRWVVL